MDAPITLCLAPMEGTTDASVREVLGALGGVDYCVSEFVRVSQDVLSPRGLLAHCPELRRAGRTASGVPVHVQLLGGDAGRVAQSAAVAVALGARVIDLNFGCPAPTVNRHDGGATLLRDPRRVEAVTAAVRAAVAREVPVSAKVRLGWSDPDDVTVIARAAEAGGAAWVTVHGRTRVQGYAPPADWARIGRAREAVAIPVVANGDIASPADLARCRDATGCARFMVGRGAIARPELFRVLAGLQPGWWTPAARLEVLERFVAVSGAWGEGRERVTLARLKQWCRVMAAAGAVPTRSFEALKRCDELPAAREALARAIELEQRDPGAGAGTADPTRWPCGPSGPR